MASESEKRDWLPERAENILGAETTTTTTTTGNVTTSHTTSRTGSSQNDLRHNTESSQTENYGSIVKDDADYDRPELRHTQASSTEIEDEKDLRIHRTQTSKSVRERRQFAPINSGDAEELTRIATSFDGGGAGSITRISTRASAVQRRDTLADVHIGDPVLDPKSPEFDPYKWARM